MHDYLKEPNLPSRLINFLDFEDYNPETKPVKSSITALVSLTGEFGLFAEGIFGLMLTGLSEAIEIKKQGKEYNLANHNKRVDRVFSDIDHVLYFFAKELSKY